MLENAPGHSYWVTLYKEKKHDYDINKFSYLMGPILTKIWSSQDILVEINGTLKYLS